MENVPMTQAVLTIERAPRDRDELARVGRYQLHLLAEQLGAVDTPDAKAAWNRASQEERVDRVHALLLERDRAPRTAAPVTSLPARGATHAPAVRPDAVAAARAAAAPAPPARPPAPQPAGDPELLAGVHRLLDETRGLCERVDRKLDASVLGGDGLAVDVAALTKSVHALAGATEITLGMLLLLVRRQLKIEPAAAIAQARAAAAEARKGA
jgi:hypothetical protein